MKIEQVKIKDLKPSEYNPRAMTEKEAKDLEESIKRFGFVEPIVVNKAPKRWNIIIGGHQRFFIARDMKMETIPVVYVDIPDIKKEQELNLRLNKNLGHWDYDLLANLEEELLMDVGFESEELDEIFGLEIDEEFDAEKEIEKVLKEGSKRAKKGDLWQLGEHRLLCGDATKREDVEKLMGREKADMVFTDPPYGMNLNTDFSSMKGIGRGKKYDKVVGDDKVFNPQPFIELFSYCKEQFWWGADYYAENIKDKNKGSWFVWDKTEGGISPNSAYEKQFGSNFELCWSRKRHKRQIIRVLWKGIFGLSKEDTKKRIHPTQKPVRLCEWFIKKFSKRGDIVLDLFAGSGSTIIACEIMKRKCRAIEIEPLYGEVIIKRYEQFTGKKVTKVTK